MIRIIKFYSSGCGPCRMLQPILQDLQKDYKFELQEVCIDNGIPEEYDSLEINCVPTLAFYENGILKCIQKGFCNENKLKQILKSLVI